MANLQYTLEVIKERQGRRVKSAADAPSEFDKAFSTLVHAYVKASLPSVVKREIGFKVLDRDEEGYRGAGAMAINLGQIIGYVLFFFDTGKLYGEELLYLPDLDLIVPFTEDWVEALSNQDWTAIGQGVDKTEIPQDLPNVRYIFESPRKKSASANLRWKPLLVKIAEQCPPIARTVIEIFAKRAEFLKSYVDSFGTEAVRRIMKAAQSDYIDLPKQAEFSTRPLRIIRYPNDPIPPWISEKQRSDLIRKGYLILDGRSETAKTASWDLEKVADVFAEPDSPVLVERNGVRYVYFPKDGLVISPADAQVRDPRVRDTGGATVRITSEGKIRRVWINRRPFRVNKANEKELADACQRFLASCPTAAQFAEKGLGRDADWNAVIVFFDEKSGKTIIGEGSLTIAGSQVIVQCPNFVIKTYPGDGVYKYEDRGKLIVMVPDSARVIAPAIQGDAVEQNPIVQVGYASPLDDEMDGFEMAMAKAASLEVARQDDKYIINKKSYSRIDAIWYLVSEWDLREKNAELLLDEAEPWPKRYAVLGRKEVKNAQGPEMVGAMPPAGPAPAPAPVSGQQIGQLDNAMQTRVPQAQDTALLAAALEANSHETIIDQYLPGMLIGINAMGHLILNMIWHRNRLADRYGESQYSSLLDLIRDTFVNTGKLYLKLRGKGPDIIRDLDKVSELDKD